MNYEALRPSLADEVDDPRDLWPGHAIPHGPNCRRCELEQQADEAEA